MKEGGKLGGGWSGLRDDERSQAARRPDSTVGSEPEPAVPTVPVADNDPAGDEPSGARSDGSEQPEIGFIPATSRCPSMPGAYRVDGPGRRQRNAEQEQDAELGSPTPSPTTTPSRPGVAEDQPSPSAAPDAAAQGEISLEATEAWAVDEEAERAEAQRLQDELQRVKAENELLRSGSLSVAAPAEAAASSVAAASLVAAASPEPAASSVAVVGRSLPASSDRTTGQHEKLTVSRFALHRRLCTAAAVALVLCAVVVGVTVGMTGKNKDQNLEETDVSRDDSSLAAALHAPPIPEPTSEFLSDYIDAISAGRVVKIASSADGTTVAIPYVTDWVGVVRVVRYDPESDSWVQFGNELEEGKNGDKFGHWLDLSSDGNVLAVSMPWSDPMGLADAGSVRVFKAENNEWAQMGQDIEGDFEAGWAGSTMSLSADGRMIAVASPGAGYGGGNQGRARVFRFDDSFGVNGVWRQVGDDFYGDGAESSLSYVALSGDGRSIALGIVLDDGNGKDSGLLRVFELDEAEEEWVQIGSSIRGEAAGDLAGTLPRLSEDGKTLTFSAVGNGGYVRVLKFVDNKWHQLGMDIHGAAVVVLSADESTIIRHQLYPVATVFRFDGTSWQEQAQFVSGQFFPLAFAADNGAKIMGIAKSRDGHGPTLGFYQMD